MGEITISKVYAIKLSSGEELLGKIQEETITSYILQDARILMQDMNGALKLGPFMFSASPEHVIELSKNAVAAKTKYLRDGLEAAYSQSVSKLVIPNKQILRG
jgi:hypothetical protein